MVTRKVQFVSISGFRNPWARQIPGGGNIWGSTEYLETFDEIECPDWLVVYDTWIQGRLLTNIPWERRILICAEPQTFHRYQERFLSQFGHIITTQRVSRHPGVIYSQPAINWLVGVRFGATGEQVEFPLRFEDFELPPPSKTKLCSVICSNKAMSSGHRKRLAFVERIKSEFGDQIDVFGRGFHEIRDKDEALADYRYHIAIENSIQSDYWTEKLADAFLRGCFPIYAGCPNLNDYFPLGSYEPINIDQPNKAIGIIRSVLSSEIDQERKSELAEAKQLVLWKHNMPALLERIYPILDKGTTQTSRLVTPDLIMTDHECKDQKLTRRIRRYIRGLVG
jgi:hypothetical protein